MDPAACGIITDLKLTQPRVLLFLREASMAVRIVQRSCRQL